MSCAKMAEPIDWDAELDGCKEHALHGSVDAPQVGALLLMSERLKSIVKHRILGV